MGMWVLIFIGWVVLIIVISSIYQIFVLNKEEHEEDIEIKNEYVKEFKYKKYLNVSICIRDT